MGSLSYQPSLSPGHSCSRRCYSRCRGCRRRGRGAGAPRRLFCSASSFEFVGTRPQGRPSLALRPEEKLMAKTAVKAKKDLKKPQHPQQRKTTDARASRLLLLLVGAAGLIALIGIGLVLTRGSGTARVERGPLRFRTRAITTRCSWRRTRPISLFSARIRVFSAQRMGVEPGRRLSWSIRTL